MAALLDAPLDRIASAGLVRIAEAIGRVREGRLAIKPGYDGVYGTVKIFADLKPDQARLDL